MNRMKFQVICNNFDSNIITNLTDVASEFESTIKLISNGKEADAKSLINVMALGVTNNEKIEIISIGSDAIQALESIKDFLLNNNIAKVIE